jgi:site-specific recombinase XerC
MSASGQERQFDSRSTISGHTTGSRTLRKTGNLKVVQTLLGHSTIAITAEFYANVTVEDVRAAMEATAAAAEPIALPPELQTKKEGEP